ncbi:hypothetical protein RclHR1_01150012 [Rhizophagus clarus]|uniref:Uncharacterized protein n=1 Tax=Rhizophagus clarus TaxID=94130 RepID=A0A2Z6QW62_9GLOM|nr:hypothetical protein RclHR1_01150012 [Rhizophagus clarus]
MPTVIVNVEYLSKSVFGWEGLPVDENINVDHFTKIFTKTSEKEKIGLKCDVWETAKNYGKYITFKLKDNDYFNESTTKTKNAFELMRIASTLNYLPEFNLPKNSSDQLHIDLCELIKTKGSRWIGKDNANVIGKKFITDLSKSIWYIDSCSFKTIDDRRRCRFIEKIKNAFLFKAGKYTYYHGNIQNSVYLWRIDNNANEEELANKHYKIRNNLKQTIQIYHTRAMRKEFIDTVELCIGKVERQEFIIFTL